MTIRLVIADHQPLVVEGMRSLFAAEPDVSVLAACVDSNAALAAVGQHRPDVVVTDLHANGADGFGVLRSLHAEHRSTRIVLHAAALGAEQALEATRLGVCGVVLKDMPPRQLVQCVRKVAAGGKWLEMSSFRSALDRLLARETALQELGRTLTPREIEIVRGVSSGLRNKHIGRDLKIAEGTVKIHLHRIFRKLGVRSRMSLGLYARDRGLV